MLVEHHATVCTVVHKTYLMRIMDTGTLYHYSKMSCPPREYLIKKVCVFTHLCNHAVLWLSDVYSMTYLLFDFLIRSDILQFGLPIDPIAACAKMSMPASRLRSLPWIPVL